MKKELNLYVGKRAYIFIGKRPAYAEWDGAKWKELPWPTRR